MTTYRKTTEQFINESKSIHDNKYDYSLVDYHNIDSKVDIICPVHGKFKQTPRVHLRGGGCKHCRTDNNNKKIKQKHSKSFIEKSREVHRNFYDYSSVIYESAKKKVTIICPKHGKFEQKPTHHMNGSGCPQCAVERTSNISRSNTEDFIKSSRRVHGDQYHYDLADYKNTENAIKITCPVHGTFLQRPGNHLRGTGCPSCGQTISKQEHSISDFIQNMGIEQLSRNVRNIIPPLEIDIYLPDQHIGIEYCGLRWHSDQFKDKDYHKNKLQSAEAANIRLIQIFEDEWLHKQDIVKDKLTSILGFDTESIYARKCKVAIISAKQANALHQQNHIQGPGNCSIHIGLFHNDECVSALSFRRTNEGFDLNRFSSSVRVVGGFSKMLKFFISIYNPSVIFTFADRRWSNGNLYLKNGFQHVYNTQPNYFYVKRGQRFTRNKFQKHKLKSQLEYFDPTKSERNNMIENGFSRIYDCGHMKFLLRV